MMGNDEQLGKDVNYSETLKKNEQDPIMPIPYDPPKFAVDDNSNTALQYLEDNGYVVFKNVANEAEIQKAKELFWNFAESNPDGQQEVFRDKPQSWGSSLWAGDNPTGVVFSNGVGQSPFLWYCRTIPNVKKIFTLVWKGEDDLLTSFDGCGVFRPPELNSQWLTKGVWYHVDQNVYRKPGQHCIQGLLNLFPSGKTDGGLVVVPKSTHMIEKAFKEHDDIVGKDKGDFAKINPSSSWWVESRSKVGNDDHDLRPVKLCLNPGDFVMWDSRTIHCNSAATPLNENTEAISTPRRLVAYICMTPACKAQNLEELVKKRVYAFQNGVTTNHWPHEFHCTLAQEFKHCPVGPSHVQLTSEQVQLITGKSINIDVHKRIEKSEAFPNGAPFTTSL